MAAFKEVFIVAAKRTPFGTFGGKLKNFSATKLGAEAAKAAMASISLDPGAVDMVIMGNVAQTSKDAAYIARHAGLMAGVPHEKTALTVNRLCGSGFQSIITGLQEIVLGEGGVALCGGAESMSQAPLAVYGQNARWGSPLGAGMQLEDTLWAALTDSYCKLPMGITAENLADKYGISREECDEYAYRSQQTWSQANATGVFSTEMAPLEVKGKKGKTEKLEQDEHPRPDTSLEQMAKLKPVFKSENGRVTAGNASGICDGAGAVVIADKDSVQRLGLSPLARIVSYQVSGVDPTIMGIGPAPAIRGALKKANLSLADIDLIEINEAFAAQYLACEKELGLDRNKVNCNGGAIALGHPLAASGSRIMTHLTHSLVRTRKKYAVGAACIGGGQGIAIIIENMQQ